MAPLDIEAFVDRLRFMGLNGDVVDEADRRLRTDEADWNALAKSGSGSSRRHGSLWGAGAREPLVDAEWRGRATVRAASAVGSGGQYWVNVIDPPRELLDKYVVLGTGVSGSGDGDEAVSFTGGLCSSAVAAVETVDSTGARTFSGHDPLRQSLSLASGHARSVLPVALMSRSSGMRHR